MEVLLGGQLTMGPRVRVFEQEFAKTVGARNAVMVNSGSSANLLAWAALTNPLREQRLDPGDRVAVPAVCWSTSLWPIIQTGLTPVLIDVDPDTLNLSTDSLERALGSDRIDAVMMVHTLGNSTDLRGLLDLSTRHGLTIVEDACESLGSTYSDQWLGSIGSFGTFSFYFSHHMTTIEGGMIVTDNDVDDDLLRCLRSHGWSREQRNRSDIERDNPGIDPRFLFVNLGFNVRPMEIQAAFGMEQIRRLDTMNAHRRQNASLIRQAFTQHHLWGGQLRFPDPARDVDPCWFGFPFLIDESVGTDLSEVKNRLLESGIDTRPIVSGNMARQPALRHLPVDLRHGPFTGADLIHDRGLFIGVHSKPLSSSRIEWLVGTVLSSLDT